MNFFKNLENQPQNQPGGSRRYVQFRPSICPVDTISPRRVITDWAQFWARTHGYWDIDDLKICILNNDKFLAKTTNFLGYPMGKCKPERVWAWNEGFYSRLLSLYYHYFLHLYHVPEQKIENIKKSKKKVYKNPPEIPPRVGSVWTPTLSSTLSPTLSPTLRLRIRRRRRI